MNVINNTGAGVAKLPRPDLVKAHVAPNPDHGFTIPLNGTVASKLEGKVTVMVWVTDALNKAPGVALAVPPLCLCDGKPCKC